MLMTKFSHYKNRGEVNMVDVSAKLVTNRTAAAQAFVTMTPRVARQVKRLANPKGNPLEVARIAGIAAAKRTADLIPLCHPLPLTHVDVTARLCQNGVQLRSTVSTAARTGVEMEALVAVTAAALTVYDMCKALDKAMEITRIVLLEKTGGASGDFFRRSGTSDVSTARAAAPARSKRSRKPAPRRSP
ncbi:MAG: cyclic pyranopterin monophosphate synthase MoaC [Candidatus Acidiferrum sp.]